MLPLISAPSYLSLSLPRVLKTFYASLFLCFVKHVINYVGNIFVKPTFGMVRLVSTVKLGKICFKPGLYSFSSAGTKTSTETVFLSAGYSNRQTCPLQVLEDKKKVMPFPIIQKMGGTHRTFISKSSDLALDYLIIIFT